MANRAAQQLAALLDVSNVPEAPDARVQLEELDTDNVTSRRRAVPEDADFAAPEALATAVAGSFILGPIGGLLLGAAQGILGEQMRQGQLDAVAAEANALAESDEVVSATFDRQRASLTNPLDLQQLDTIQSQYNAARKLMQSPFEETKKKGMALMASALQAQREFDVRQEEQAIAASLADEEVRRAIGQENFDRYKSGIARFTKQSAPYLAVRQSVKSVFAALDEGTPVGQMAAIKLLEKALDPTSVVRPEEQEAYGQMGSLLVRGSALFERLESGKPLLPEQVIEIKSLVSQIDRIALDFQKQREARFANENDDIDLPEKFRDNFVISTPFGANRSGNGFNDEPGFFGGAIGSLTGLPPGVITGTFAVGGGAAAGTLRTLEKSWMAFKEPYVTYLERVRRSPGGVDRWNARNAGKPWPYNSFEDTLKAAKSGGVIDGIRGAIARNAPKVLKSTALGILRGGIIGATVEIILRAAASRGPDISLERAEEIAEILSTTDDWSNIDDLSEAEKILLDRVRQTRQQFPPRPDLTGRPTN